MARRVVAGSTATVEARLRNAARALHDAIGDAEAAGYQIAWPRRANDLLRLAISETRRVPPVMGIPMTGEDPENPPPPPAVTLPD